MARCGCAATDACNCAVSAGSGVTVSGSGTPGNPYVVSVDTIDCDQVRPCISAGQGASYNPVSGIVAARLSPGVGNQIEFAPDGGLYVDTDCTTVRGCLSEGNGIDYDPLTGTIAARPSTDVGNSLSFGGDGGLFVPTGSVDCTAVRGCLSEGNGIDYDPLTGVIAARPSTDVGNTLQFGGDGGLFVPTPAAVSCTTVRGCLSEGDGIDYDPLTGVIAARPSTDVGNTLQFGGDGGLFVPDPTVDVACGLNGNGSAGSPLAVDVVNWPFPCSVDTFGGDLYCDTNGRLRTFPRPTVRAEQTSTDQNYPATAVPTAADVSVEVRNFPITNTDTCRPAFVIFEGELDVDLTLPANAAAMYGIGGDDMLRFHNRGANTESQVHVQVTKVYNRVLAPGAALVEPFDIHMGMGTNGATYTRIQTIHRAFIFNL